MSDGDVMLRGILEEPKCNTRRLGYADWLEENDQRRRAYFIRQQCLQIPSPVPIRAEDLSRWSRFRTPFGAIEVWENGFIYSLHWPLRFFWKESRLRRVFAHHPIQDVCLFDVQPDEVACDNGTVEHYFPVGQSDDEVQRLPAELAVLLPGGERARIRIGHREELVICFESSNKAIESLSDGAVRYGRHLLGLPPLKEYAAQTRGTCGGWQPLNTDMFGGAL